MRIWSWVQAFPDDQDVLADSLNSLSEFSDRIFLVDGGFDGALCHHQRYTQRLGRWLLDRSEFNMDDLSWNGKWLSSWQHPFNDPGSQRNWMLKEMEKMDNQPDWYCWIDSDEICSWEFINGIRSYLESLPNDVTNVCPKWLTLVQDEKHIVQHMSNWLAHGRLYRPRTTYYNSGWHEHQYYEGKRVQWDTRIIHTRALFRTRLYVQRGHPMVAGRDNPLWGDAVMVDLPDGVTWPTLHWPQGEVEIPFEVDIRDFENGKYAVIPE